MPSDDLPRSVWDLPLGPWTNQPRFYPPGQHPATAPWRKQIDDLELWKEMGSLSGEGQKMLDWLYDQLALFDSVEAEIRARLDQQLWVDFMLNEIQGLPER